MHKRGQGWRNGPRVSALVRLLREQGLAGRGSVASATAGVPEGLISSGSLGLFPVSPYRGTRLPGPKSHFLDNPNNLSGAATPTT